MTMNQTGTLSYNGYQWDASSRVIARIEPIYDDANRSRIKHRLTVTVQWIVTTDAGTDATMTAIRDRITQPGKLLYIIGYGLGNDYRIGGTEGVWKDVSFGPKPQIVVWEPLGGANACACQWECVAEFIPCGNRSENQPTAMSYEVVHDLDERGLCVRSMTGYIEIANFRNGGAAAKTPDDLRSFINSQVPLGFQRRQNYHASADGTRLYFNVTDSQVPSRNAYPAGITKVDATHEIQWRREGKSAAYLYNVISATYEVAPNAHPAYALRAFVKLWEARWKIAKQYHEGLFLDAVRISEEIYGLTVSCEVAYRVIGGDTKYSPGGGGGGSSISFNPGQAGMFLPSTDNWTDWRASMSESFSPYGQTKMQALAGERLIGMCENNSPIPAPVTETKPATIVGNATFFRNSVPPKNKSWLYFNAYLNPASSKYAVRQSELQTAESEAPEATISQASFGLATSPTETKIQVSGKSEYYIVFAGSARRAGHEIPNMSLKSINGVPCTAIRKEQPMKIAGNLFGVTIYESSWKHLYVLPKSPGTIKPIGNWAERIDQNGNVTL